MGTARQQLLFPEPTAESLLSAVRARLGTRTLTTVSAVAQACNVSVTTVYHWIEEGLVQAVNVGSGTKGYYQVFAPSVLEFYRKRLEESQN